MEIPEFRNVAKWESSEGFDQWSRIQLQPGVVTGVPQGAIPNPAIFTCLSMTWTKG